MHRPSRILRILSSLRRHHHHHSHTHISKSPKPLLPLPLPLLHQRTPPPHLLQSHKMTTAGAAETDSQAAATAINSGITPSTLSDTLREKLGATHVDIRDMSGGCGQAFEAIIVSGQFEKKPTLARHRLVNGVLKEEIAAIHAWTPKCLTPGEWERRTGGAGGEREA